MIYPSRSVEQKNLDDYRELLESGRVLRIYLDELPDAELLGKDIGLFKLLIEPEKSAPTVARQLMENATAMQINLIEQIIAHKFVKLSREEIKKMLGLQEELFKETQFYKDVFQEGKREGKREGELSGKLAAVPVLREVGLTDEAIAQRLNLPIELVKAAPQARPSRKWICRRNSRLK